MGRELPAGWEHRRGRIANSSTVGLNASGGKGGRETFFTYNKCGADFASGSALFREHPESHRGFPRWPAHSSECGAGYATWSALCSEHLVSDGGLPWPFDRGVYDRREEPGDVELAAKTRLLERTADTNAELKGTPIMRLSTPERAGTTKAVPIKFFLKTHTSLRTSSELQRSSKPPLRLMT